MRERENYLCKHNNIKYKGLGTEGYIEVTKVRECKRKSDDEWWRGRRVWLGLDLSMSDDNVCLDMKTFEGNTVDNCELFTRTWGFIPTEKIDYKTKREAVDYRKLIREVVEKLYPIHLLKISFYH